VTLDAGAAVQTAVWQALTADPPIGAGVYDRLPENAPYPQIEITGGAQRDWSHAVVRGEQITVELHIWSRYNGFAEARSLMAQVRKRLDLQPLVLPVEGMTLVDLMYTTADLMLDVDMMTRHGIVRFNATVTVP
jgi:Protein of unknown function (DUF3168)